MGPRVWHMPSPEGWVGTGPPQSRDQDAHGPWCLRLSTPSFGIRWGHGPFGLRTPPHGPGPCAAAAVVMDRPRGALCTEPVPKLHVSGACPTLQARRGHLSLSVPTDLCTALRGGDEHTRPLQTRAGGFQGHVGRGWRGPGVLGGPSSSTLRPEFTEKLEGTHVLPPGGLHAAGGRVGEASRGGRSGGRADVCGLDGPVPCAGGWARERRSCVTWHPSCVPGRLLSVAIWMFCPPDPPDLPNWGSVGGNSSRGCG